MVTTVEQTDSHTQIHVAAGYHGALLQHCQSILARLNWPDVSGPRTLGVTSCLSGEGVSTVASHLAATAASSDKGPILLVDANQSRPSVHDAFGVPRGPGFHDLLRHPQHWGAAVRRTEVTALSVLAVGAEDLESGGAIDPKPIESLLRQLNSRFRLTVFDMPPAHSTGWAQDLASRLDGVLMVVESERVRREVARRTLEDLQCGGTNVVGAVLNKRPQHIPTWLYQKL